MIRKIIYVAVAMLTAALLFSSLSVPVSAADEEKNVLYWVAPMDPNYQRDKPGKSPMGMDLIPVYDDGNATGSVVTIRPEVVQNLGVRTATAERSRLWRGIDTVGYVDYDESKVSHIHLRTEGWIEDLVVRSEGERVKKGERLFNFYSPELVNAQEEYIQTLRGSNQNLISDSAERLVALGISVNQIKDLRKTRKARQSIAVYAPQDGVVSALQVRDGMFVNPTMRVMTLADLSSIWLLAEIFERQTAWVKEGQPAEVRVSYLPGQVWEGKVEYIYPSLDAKTRTLKVRLRFDNPNELLKPNMYANIKIFGGAKNEVVTIPLEALIRSGRDQRVILALGEGRFEARHVTTGIESGQWVEIQSGIDEGDKVVVSGQFLVDSEASLKASFTRMRTNDVSAMESDTGVDEDATGKKVVDEKIIEARTIEVVGIIREIKADQGIINLQHEPVDALGWSAMTMDFRLMDKVNIEGLQVNDAVTFTLEEVDDRYFISKIDKAEVDKDMAREK